MSLHPHNLAQKTEIIIEHFRNMCKENWRESQSNGICGSRLHAKRYYESFKSTYTQKDTKRKLKFWCFFRKSNRRRATVRGFEPKSRINGEKELPGVFNTDELKSLLWRINTRPVRQPLLHTMYVDKKLSE